ncbi:MAG TPA: alkaline phosphatase family protein [Gemmatimonadales bacterium]|nr:alkaline phosphatase family protein [Gemmatimonadales bacterium]
MPADSVYQRVFILELSGPTLEFLQARRDSLPNFRAFLDQGAHGRLRGPLQPVAPQSFATLLTGRNPGATGLFDFFKFPAGGYDRVPYGTHLLRPPTFYQQLSDAGKRVGLLNVPLTHPLPQVNGFVVSGDEGIGDEFAFPPELGRRLRADGYFVPFGASYSPGREREIADHSMQVLAMRRRAMRSLFGDGDWDFGMLTIHMYGELLHAFWKFYDPAHPDYRPVSEIFGGRDPLLEGLATIDEMLGEIVELAGPRGLVLFLGAWGHRLEHSKVHLNAVLEREGYLRFRGDARTRLKRAVFRAGLSAATAERAAHRLNLYKLFHYRLGRGQRAKVTGAAFLSYRDVDWAATRAVAMGYLGQVYLNVRGHRPLGPIAPDQYQAERDRLQRILADLRDPRTGQAIVERVFAREEIYRGEELANAPDLVVEWKPGYSGDAGLSGGGKVVTASPPNHSSDHYNESVLLARGAGVRPVELTATLQDIAPTVLQALGVSAPADLEGKVLPLFGSP